MGEKKRSLAAAFGAISSTLEILSGDQIVYDDVPRLYFAGRGGRAVVKGLDNIDRFREAVTDVWHGDPALYYGFTRKRVEGQIVQIFRDVARRGRAATLEDLKDGVRDLRDKPTQSYEVFRPAWGCSLSGHISTLGPYTVYSWPRDRDTILSNYPRMEEADQALRWSSDPDPKVLVSIRVDAKEPDRAMELADPVFFRFENLLRFIIHDSEGLEDVSLLGFEAPGGEQAAALTRTPSGSTWQSKWSARGPIRDLDLSTPTFQSDPAHVWLWTAAAAPTPTDLQRRVLTAVDWIGRGLRDRHSGKQFVQYALALESLLQIDEKDPFRPSTTSQLAEYAAFLLGSDYEERTAIEKRIRQIYGRRSAVVHGRSAEVQGDDLGDLFGYLVRLIETFCTHPELCQIKDFTAVREWVQVQKYGGGPPPARPL